MSQHTQERDQEQAQEKRPTGLLVLCILTMISTGWQLLGSLGGVASGAATSKDLSEVKLKYAELINLFKEFGQTDGFEPILKMQDIEIAVVENLQFFSFLGLVFAGVGLFGAFKMYNGSKLGFHLYIVYSFLSLIHYHFVMSPSEIPMHLLVVNGLFSLLLVFLYSRHLKWMQAS